MPISRSPLLVTTYFSRGAVRPINPTAPIIEQARTGDTKQPMSATCTTLRRPPVKSRMTFHIVHPVVLRLLAFSTTCGTYFRIPVTTCVCCWTENQVVKHHSATTVPRKATSTSKCTHKLWQTSVDCSGASLHPPNTIHKLTECRRYSSRPSLVELANTRGTEEHVWCCDPGRATDELGRLSTSSQCSPLCVQRRNTVEHAKW